VALIGLLLCGRGLRFVDTACSIGGYRLGDTKGNRMKIAFAVLTLCACAQGALAAGPECRTIESTSGRLACYDAATPPRIAKPVAIEGDASRPPYKDPFIAEDARTTAKLKGICRGC
jgi:hypothetical protein